MITIATLLWDGNEHVQDFSRCYDETWAEKLYRGFARNLTQPFDFVCFVDRERDFAEPIKQEPIEARPIGYSACIEPYRMNVPMILVGLDTIITGNIDHLAEYALAGNKLALPKAVYREGTCNGVALVPDGSRAIYDRHSGENDMFYMESQDHVLIDDLWPGHVVSYKGHVKEHGLGDARIVFFHGKEKPHEIGYKEPWIREHWV